MSKFLIILLLLAGSSLFAVEAFALEVEIQKESDRIIESKGWLTPELHSFQEQFQIIIDHTNSKSRISIGLLSTHPNDIKFPDYIEKIADDPRIFSFQLTNQFACSPNHTERGCVIIEILRDGLGDDLEEIKKNSREIADEIVGKGVIVFGVEFDSIKIKPQISFDGSKKVVVSQVLYTTNKQTTSSLFDALSTMLVSTHIRESGGFYDHAEKLAQHHFAEFNISLIPLEKNALRTLHISLTCSDKQSELPDCPEEFDNMLADDKISPLEILGVENINRSKLFEDKFLPLNSIVQVLIFSDKDLQVKSVNSGLIEKLQHLGNVQENGWFFTSKSGQMIDGRYIFATESSASKNDLTFLIGDNTGDDILIKKSEIKNSEIKNSEDGGGCLIATAAFGSEMSPQVQFLREIRDNTVLQTESGTRFMADFNQFYYSFSPTIADYERENSTFKEAVKMTLTPLLTSLTLLQYVDIDSESEMLGYGIGIILLNIGMYFVAPAVLIMKIKKRI